MLVQYITSFNGSIYFDKEGISIYKLSSFLNIRSILNYLDKYNLQSYKYLQYIFLRKTYLLMEKKEHLTEKGLDKIKNYKTIYDKF